MELLCRRAVGRAIDDVHDHDFVPNSTFMMMTFNLYFSRDDLTVDPTSCVANASSLTGCVYYLLQDENV